MRIALVSTCALATPPHKYGGTELVVAELARGLVNLNHEVTVFATGDSAISGCKLRYHFATPVWPPNELAEGRHACHAWRAIANAVSEYDVVHVHHAAALPYQTLVPLPTVMTIHHTRIDELAHHYAAFSRVAYVAISQRQAALLPELNVRRVIHHGLDPARYAAGTGAGGYVAFLGRLAPEKAPHLAVHAARLAGVRLRIGGTHHEVAERYYRDVVQPLLNAGSNVECCGELGHEAKLTLLQGASALLFPIEWEEPFGLVMIESMLVGTPVIAFRHGSAPEVVEDGVTGYLVDSAEEMAERIQDLDKIDRVRCRERARSRWCAARMAREYAELYEQVAHQRRNKSPLRVAAAPSNADADALLRSTHGPTKEHALTKERGHAADVRSGRS